MATPLHLFRKATVNLMHRSEEMDNARDALILAQARRDRASKRFESIRFSTANRIPGVVDEVVLAAREYNAAQDAVTEAVCKLTELWKLITNGETLMPGRQRFRSRSERKQVNGKQDDTRESHAPVTSGTLRGK